MTRPKRLPDCVSEGQATHAFVPGEPAVVREQRATAAIARGIARPMPVLAYWRPLPSYSNFSNRNEQAWAMGDEMTGLGFGRGWELLQTHDNTRVIGDEVLPSCTPWPPVALLPLHGRRSEHTLIHK